MTLIRLLVLLGLLAFGRSQGSLRKGAHVAQESTAISEPSQRELEIEEYPIELEPFHIVYHHHPRRDQSFEEMEEMDVLVATRNYLVQRLSLEQPDYFLRLLLYLFIREDDEYMTKVAYSGTAFYSKQYMRNISNTVMRQQVQDTAWLAFLGDNKTDYLSELTRNNVFDIDSITLLNAGGHIVGVDRVSGELLTITSPPATTVPPTNINGNSTTNAPPNTDMSSTVSMTIYLCSIIIPLVVFSMVITWWVARKLRFDVVWTRPRELDPENQIWHTSRRLERRFYKPKSGSQSGSETTGSAASTRIRGNNNQDKATKYSLIPVHIVSVQDATSTSTTTLSKKEKKVRKPQQDSSEQEFDSTTCVENGLRIDQNKPKAKAKPNPQRCDSKGAPSSTHTTISNGEPVKKSKKRISQSSKEDATDPIKPLRKQSSQSKALDTSLTVQESRNDIKSTAKASKGSLDGSKSKSKTDKRSAKGNKGKEKDPAGRKLHEKSNAIAADTCITKPSHHKTSQSEGPTSSCKVKTKKRTSKKESKTEANPSKTINEPKPTPKKEPKAKCGETEPCAKPKRKSSRIKQSTAKASQLETG